MKHNKRAAIELSMNFLVVIIISIVILSSGLVLFFKLKNNAVAYVEGVDSNTQSQLRAMMLNNNYVVSLYPTDITLTGGKSATVGIGVTNNAEYPQNFSIRNESSVMYYITSDSNPQNKTGLWNSKKSIIMNSVSTINPPGYSMYNFINLNVKPKEQIFKNFLITVPSGSLSGSYVIKFVVVNSTSNSCYSGLGGYCNVYGIVKLYVNVP